MNDEHGTRNACSPGRSVFRVPSFIVRSRRDGHPQRHARFLLRRRRAFRPRARPSRRRCGWRQDGRGDHRRRRRVDAAGVGGVSARRRAGARRAGDRGHPPAQRRRRSPIDTRKARVAAAALEAGADIINDVSALRHDPDMRALAATRGVPVILMHMRGEPRTMQETSTVRRRGDDVARELATWRDEAVAAGVDPRADPGRSRHRLRQDVRAQPRAARALRRADARSRRW